MTDRALMQQALEAVEGLRAAEQSDGAGGGGFVHRPATRDHQARVLAARKALHKAEEALRARLAEPEPEPVAWRVMLDDDVQFVYDERMLPVIDESIHATRQPLYTTPPTRRPLTDEEIDRITRDKWGDMLFSDVVEVHREFARAIERAHNITGGNDE